tara:strand:+ start:645 stop:791 length:147 start_codon:yes stop_codon:yes gene_type:complete
MSEPISNEIFEHFRTQQREVKDAINILEERGFSVYDKHNKLVIFRNDN